MGMGRRIGAGALVWTLLCGCVPEYTAPRVRLNAPESPLRAGRTGPALDGFNCYFLVSVGSENPEGVPPCVRLGKTGNLGTYSELTTTGLTVKVPGGFRRTIRLYGAGSGACGSVNGVGELFNQSVRPSLYYLGETTINAFASQTVELETDYDPNGAEDLAACADSNVAPLSLSASSPARGIRRGGASLTVTGEGFVGGTQVSVGGTPCESVSVSSSTELTCVAPQLTPGDYSITLTNPDATTAGSAAGAYAARVLVMTAQNAAAADVSAIQTWWQELDGTLTAAGSYVTEKKQYSRWILHPKGRFLFVAKAETGREGMDQLRIVPHTGAVEYVQSFLGGNGRSPTAFGFNASGSFLVAGSSEGGLIPAVHVWSVNGLTGSVQEVVQAAAPVLDNSLNSLVIHPSGWVLETESTQNRIRTLALSGLGQVTDAGQFLTVTTPQDLFFYPAKGRLYAGANIGGRVYGSFPVVGDNGAVENATSVEGLAGPNFGLLRSNFAKNVLYQNLGTTNQIFTHYISSDGAVGDQSKDQDNLEDTASSPLGSLSGFAVDDLGQFFYAVESSLKRLTARAQLPSGRPTVAATTEETVLHDPLLVEAN